MKNQRRGALAVFTFFLGFLIPVAGAVEDDHGRSLSDDVETTRRVYEQSRDLNYDSKVHFDIQTPGLDQRTGEFDKFAAVIERLEKGAAGRSGSRGAKDRMALPHVRPAYAGGAEAAQAWTFLTGPGKTVHPHNGETVLVRTDIERSGRGGLDFLFRRYYRSFLDYDGPMGKGWDHNHNIRLLFDPDDSSRLFLLNGRDKIAFRKTGDDWLPEPGRFYALAADPSGAKASVTTPDGMRLHFERLKEAPEAGWRIQAIATRHHGGSANRLTYSYLSGKDVLDKVTDVWGDPFSFAHDADGRLVGVSGQGFQIRFKYDPRGFLAEAVTPDVAIDASQKTDIGEAYGYRHFLDRDWLVAIRELPDRARWSFDYDAAPAGGGRIIGVTRSGGALQEVWEWAEEEKRVVVTPPAPLPREAYDYRGSAQPSLPKTVIRVADGATWEYQYNEDGLPAETRNPEGVVVRHRYDERNPDPRRRGDLIHSETLAAARPDGDGVDESDIAALGSRYTYHPAFSLPLTSEQYQRRENGKEEVLDTETWEYDGDDALLSSHTRRQVTTHYLQNRFGELAMERIGDGGCDLFFYAKSPRDKTGSPAAGGRLVRTVRDADGQDIRDHLKEIGSRENREAFLPSDENGLPRAALETTFSWNQRGELASTVTDREVEMICRNRLGLPLAVLSSRNGLEITTYNRHGQPVGIFRPHTPANGKYAGNRRQFFSGVFAKESLSHDGLGRVRRWEPTDEDTEDGLAAYTYERYPSGVARAITAPSGVARIDDYHPGTGMIRATLLQSASGETLALRTDITHYPSGAPQGYKDNSGNQWLFFLDRFGRDQTTRRPDGAEETTVLDGLGRPILELVAAAGQPLTERRYHYGRGSRPTRITVRDRTTDRETVEYEAVIDSRGLVAAQRSVREDSWNRNLFDGMGRLAATRDAGGETTTILYEGTREAMRGIIRPIYEGLKVPATSHILYLHDDRGQPVATIPVNSEGTPLLERASARNLDEAGREVQSLQGRRLLVTRVFNTLGKPISETSAPLTNEFGERVHRTENTYHGDGRLASRVIHNDPLLLGKDGSAARRPIPQTSTFGYDPFLRLVVERNPDGLEIAREYNAASLVSKMTWRKNPDNEPLRVLSVEYDSLQRPVAITDSLTDKRLRTLEYDAFGNCIRAVEETDGTAVSVKRRFDSFGELLEESTHAGDRDLPALARAIDRAAGRFATEIRHRRVIATDGWWNSQTACFDQAGRLAGLELDGTPFAAWEYAGSIAVVKKMPGANWRQILSYDANGDLTDSVLTSGRRGTTSATFAYRYGADGLMTTAGQTRHAAARSRDRIEWRYFAHDAHGRAVAEAQDHFQPGDPDRRRNDLFGYGEAAELNRISRTGFDQAGNVWLHYQGMSRKADAFLDPGGNALSGGQHPLLSSSAIPVSDGHRPDSQEILDLASNRLVAVAGPSATGEDGRFTEYEERRYHYNGLGELSRWRGKWDDGAASRPVEWRMRYNPLGTLAQMDAYAVGEDGKVTEERLASLSFLYDTFGRRVAKRTEEAKSGKTTEQFFSYYPDDRLAMVLAPEGEDLVPHEKYLWGGGERELLVACQPRNQVEDAGSSLLQRYFYLQNREFNVMALAKVAAGELVWVDEASYRLFGENDTTAEIASIMAPDAGVDNLEAMTDRKIDGGDDAVWTISAGKRHYLYVTLEEARRLEGLVIWTARDFPTAFSVYVLPDETVPRAREKGDWNSYLKPECLVQEVISEKYRAVGDVPGGLRYKTNDISDPYLLSLDGRKGAGILLSWTARDDGETRVREIQVLAEPRRNSGFAFAGQWRDPESGLYYFGARYYLPSMNGKFISPDPLGFLAGSNLYAYANNDPLTWQDPDGRLPTAVIGAGIGAVLGGGFYLVNTWWHGEEFSWRELGIQTLVGGVAGGIAGLTMGSGVIMSNLYAGAVSGGLDSLLHGGSATDILTASAGRAAMFALGGAVAGKVMGGLGGPKTLLGLTGPARGLASSILGGGAAGAAVGAASGAYHGYMEHGFGMDALAMAGKGAVKGAAFGMAAGAAAFGLAKLGEGPGAAEQRWNKERGEYWRREARNNPEAYSPSNLQNMKKGMAPQRINPLTGQTESMELHHSQFTRRSGLPDALVHNPGNLRRVWPDEHRAIDPFRH